MANRRRGTGGGKRRGNIPRVRFGEITRFFRPSSSRGVTRGSRISPISSQVVRGVNSRRSRSTRRAFHEYSESVEPVVVGESSSNESSADQSPLTRVLSVARVAQYKQLIPSYDYYYCDKFPPFDDLENKISVIEQYLVRKEIMKGHELTLKIEEARFSEIFAPVDVKDVFSDNEVLDKWPTIRRDIGDDAESVLMLWSAVCDKLAPFHDERLPKTRIGFFGMEPKTSMSDIRSTLLGDMITMQGTVVRTGNSKPWCRRMTFKCMDCNTIICVDQPDGFFKRPQYCRNEDCENRNGNHFQAMQNEKTTLVVDSRKITLQDMMCCDADAGSIPRAIDCALLGDLVVHENNGEILTVTGLVKMSRDSKTKGAQSLHNFYIEVCAVTRLNDSVGSIGGYNLNFSNKDYLAVKKVAESTNLFRLLVASLCPSIYGHELIKAGLLLCILGGRQNAKRSDINMLIVGDPGMGKSQMLKAVSQIAPKGVYVCGTGSTIAGLTVTLVRDGGDFSLEAGAMIISDRGVCIIDEFDKMASQHHALLEPMEQQTVSVAKSGVYRTFNSRTSVIAAANPIGGHYDIRKSFRENVKIENALLSRFDLIFIIRDSCDEKFDQRLIQHVLKIRKAVSTQQSNPSRSTTEVEEESFESSSLLINKLKVPKGEAVDLVPHVLLKKYLAYAKHYVNPKLSPDAATLLKNYYLEMRKDRMRRNTTPVTTRQLESMIRLTQAVAKIELREIATEEDAKNILEIFNFSQSSISGDAQDDDYLSMPPPLPNYHQQPGPSRPRSAFSNAKSVYSSLQKIAEQNCKNIFSLDEIRSVARTLGCADVTDRIINILNRDGILIKKDTRTYQLRSVDC